jgi:hypothetical protein
MKKIIWLSFFTLTLSSLKAQFVYNIKADSVLLTKDTCPAELILENRTKDTLGFLYNKGNGRTEFRRGAIKLTDSTYLFGNDIINFKSVLSSIGINNIYNTNGSLTNNRTVNFGGNYLDFSGTTPIRFWGDGKMNIGNTSILSNPGKLNVEGGVFIKKSYFLIKDADAPSNLLHTLDYSNSLYPNGMRYDFAAGYQNDTSTYAPTGTTSGIWNISFFKTDSLQSPVTNRPLMTINNGPGVGIFNTPVLKLFSTGNLVLNSNDDAGYKLDVNGTARIATLPFTSSRDTVLTYNPTTKQIQATKITLDSISCITVYTIHADAGTSITLTNQPNSEQDFNNNTRTQRYSDLSSKKQARIVCRVPTSSNSGNTPRLYLQYSTDGSTWNNIGESTNPTISLSTTGFKSTGWFTIATAARADNIYFRIAQNGGNNNADPVIDFLEVLFK